MPELDGLHAVVTGGGSGIGAATAQSLSAAGARVSLMGRDRQRLENMAASLPDAQAVSVDVADEVAVGSAFEAAAGHFGPVDILINNAGAAESRPAHRTDSALWRRTLAVNLDGVFFCTREVLPAMRKARQGRIVNIASTAGVKGYAYVSAYCAAKHGVIGLTRSVALETATCGITVNAVCPGYTDTELVSRAIDNIVVKTGRSNDEALQELASVNPQNRLVQPEEVAATVIWLCQPSAAAITGQAIVVAGGEVM